MKSLIMICALFGVACKGDAKKAPPPEPMAAPAAIAIDAAPTPMPLAADAGPAPGTPRQVSGIPRPDPGADPGTIVVRVTYDDLADPTPPADLVVTLVGYRADGTVVVRTSATDQGGQATFDGLDRSGATAYYAMALLPRNSLHDRLLSSPIQLDDSAGRRVVLSGDSRGATTPPIDELSRSDDQRATPPAGTVRVRIQGDAEPNAEVRLIDASTGDVLARGPATTEIDLAFTPTAGLVIYTETTMHGRVYRSLPVPLVPGRGTAISVYVFPVLMFSFEIGGGFDQDYLGASGIFRITNYSWMPWVPGPDGVEVEIPLPEGFAGVVIADDDQRVVSVSARGLRITRPIPPGGQEFRAGFSLPVVNGDVRWKLDLPLGSWQSTLHITQAPGTRVEIHGAPSEPRTSNGLTYLVVPDITVQPRQSIALTIAVRDLPGAAAASSRACEALRPARSALVGKPVPDVTATQLDGTAFELATLRGSVILIDFMASWDSGAVVEERPTFARLMSAFDDVAVVLVASDADRDAVVRAVGPTPGYRVVLDPPLGTDHLGPITTAWGVPAVPESFLIDRSGTVRFYFQNWRDWGSPEAAACVAALRRE